MKVKTEASVYEHFEEFVQQVQFLVEMINQLKMTRLVSLKSVIGFQEN